MRVGTVAVLLMAGWFVFLAARKYVRQRQGSRLPAGVEERPELKGYSADHYDMALQSLRAFAAEYKLTFQHGKCTKRAVLGLHSLRDDALGHMYELRMRLPNDMEAEMALTRHIEDTDRILRHSIQEAQSRCRDAALLFPGPLDDTFYREHYRAHNDVVT